MDKAFSKSVSSLNETLQESELCNIVNNAAEILIDSVIDDGLLKEIPIVKTLVGLIKTTTNISSILLLKKIIIFLDGIKNIPQNKRYKMIAEINNSPKYRIKVGEKLLYIINHCDDHDKASLISELFKAFLSEEIEYDDFLQGSSILNSIYINDLNLFLSLDENKLSVEDAMQFVGFGLYNVFFEAPELIYNPQSDWDDGPEEYKLVGGVTTVKITDIGNKIRCIFKR